MIEDKELTLGYATRGRLVRARFRQILRVAATGAALTVTALLGLASIALPLYYRAATPANSGLREFTYSFAFAAAVVGAALLIVYLSLRSLPATDYARTYLSGETISGQMTILGSETHRACRFFLKKTRSLHDELIDLDNELKIIRKISNPTRQLQARDRLGKELRQKKTAVEAKLRRLKRHTLKQHPQFSRLIELNKRAAKNLGIPEQRLCDHLLQYSPRIHESRANKYLQNWHEIVRSYGLLRPGKARENRRRFESIVEQNVYLYEKTLSRLHIQQRLIDNDDLHSFLHRFASEHSTSESLKHYARAIAFVAIRGIEELGDFDHSAATRKGDQKLSSQPTDRDLALESVYINIENRLRFIHRKQRAHSGFDLNYLCLRICREFDSDSPESNVLRKLLNREESPLILDGDLDAAALCRHVRNNLEGLAKISQLIGDSMNGKGERRHSLFGSEVFDKWFPENLRTEGKLRPILVTHGYSKTVRNILKAGIVRQANPLVLIICPRGEDALDSQLLVDELREEEHFRHSRDLEICDEALFPRLVGKDQRVLIMVGAECFDENFNVLHARGMVDKWADFIKHVRLAGSECRLLVVASEYKLSPNGLFHVEGLYRDHLDNLDLYEPSLVDAILTEEKLRLNPELESIDIGRADQPGSPTNSETDNPAS